MSTQVRCHCQSCTIRGLMGPVVVITIGVLFLLDQMHAGHFNIGHTFPVLLLVIGFVQLGSALASREGHIEAQPPVPGITPVPPPPPAGAPQPPFTSQGQ